MGDIADQIVNGDICQTCCCGEGPGEGYPFTCDECSDQFEVKDSPRAGKGKTKCPVCKKTVRKVGLQDHAKTVHPKYTQEIYRAILKVLRGEES